MTIVLALGAAAFYGSSDFMGAVATRRSAALAVALLAQVAGLLVLVAVLPLLGPASVQPSDVVAGALAGVFGAVGVVLVYQVLSRGPMSIAAPQTSSRIAATQANTTGSVPLASASGQSDVSGWPSLFTPGLAA